MFNLFKNNKENLEQQSLLNEIKETQTRFFSFVEKLEIRLKEFADASIPELTELNNSDTDNYKQGFHRMKAAVQGQLESIRKKGREVLEEKVDYFQNKAGNQYRDEFYDFRSACNSRFDQFEKLHNQYREVIDATEQEDYEIAYQKLVDEFNDIKNKFTCVQCSSPIAIDQMYFTTTYLSCPSCQTQNTYEPSSQAKQLEHLGRSLAEQRTAHLLTGYKDAPQKEHALYLQMHELEISLINERDKNVVAEKRNQIAQLQQQKEDSENARPALYQTYLRAMFDEWNAINPAMKEEHEKFYTRLLNDNN